jgi:hypothetical protein
MMESLAGNPDPSTWGRRCELGCESWPDTLEFKTCLRCGQPTERFSNLTPLSMDEARRLLNQARFNAYYSRRCEERHIPVAGALPDWYEANMGELPESLLRGTYVLPPPKK